MLSPVEMLRTRAAMCPDSPALAVGDVILTYEQWQRQAEGLVKRFETAGVRQGDTMALRFSLESFLPYAVAYVATLGVGATAVPVSEDVRDDEAVHISQMCDAKWTAFAAPAEPYGIGLEGVVPVSLDDELPLRRAPSATDVAEIIFTSGTTGEPQGVLCPYGEVGFDYDLTRPEQEQSGRGVEIHAAAFGTNFSQEMLRAPLKWGSFVVTLPRFDAGALREAIDQYGPTTLRLTPVMAQMLVRTNSVRGLDRIEEISVSSAFCPSEVFERLQALAPHAVIVNQYSLTEAGRAKLKKVWGVGPRNALGQPVEGSEVRVVRAEGACPPGVVGEIQIRHVSAVRRQYLRLGQETAEVPNDVGWIPTGDLGHMDDEGYVFLLDRAKDLINVGGRKVSPLALERVMGRQPGVTDVAVCGIPHPTLGEVVAALVVPHDLAEHHVFDVTSQLLPHETPKVVVLGTEIPRNSAGKIVRGKVRAEILARQQSYGTSAVGNEDELANAFLLICSQVLAQEISEPDLSWYAVGGDSLSAMELLAAVEDAFGVDLPVECFFGEARLSDILAQLRLQVSAS